MSTIFRFAHILQIYFMSFYANKIAAKYGKPKIKSKRATAILSVAHNMPITSVAHKYVCQFIILQEKLKIHEKYFLNIN